MIFRKNFRPRVCKTSWGRVQLLAAIAIFLSVSPGTWAQKNKNKKPADTSPMPPLPLPVSEQIDHDIGEMLGAFQVGNVEAMHKYYSDDVTFVSGTFNPPVVGWKNYVAGYEQQRAAFQGMQLVRRNTFIFVHADVSWATYQWELSTTLNGKPYGMRGQTTLVLNKVGDNWLIVHNHTSYLCDSVIGELGGQQQPANQAPAAPASQPQPHSP